MGDTEDAASRAPWSDTVNTEKNINLAAELGKDSASKGSFMEDYEAMSLAADIVPCNRFNCLQDGAVVRLRILLSTLHHGDVCFLLLRRLEA